MDEQTQSYSQRLAAGIENIQKKYPGSAELMQELKNIDSINPMEFDYPIERDAKKYEALLKFVNGLKPDSDSFSMRYIEWYSGMERQKILAAFERYKRETKNER